jgi:putative nucleotidyltransferase with HDIG domain
MDKIDEVLNRVQKLAPAPQLLPRLLRMLSDVDTDLAQIVDVISFDPALTAKLLQICNSPVFRGNTRVNDVSEAVNRLGLKTVYGIVAAVIGVKSVKFTAAPGGKSANEIWRHSVIAAFAAQFLSEDITPDSGLLFTTGLLHEIGQVVITEAFKGRLAPAVPDADKNPRLMVEVERKHYGVDHAELGARLLERWNFSPTMVDCVRFHHEPAGSKDNAALAACVSLGDTLAYGLEQESRGQAILWPESGSSLGILRLAEDDLKRYLERIKENLEFVESMCRLQN